MINSLTQLFSYFLFTWDNLIQYFKFQQLFQNYISASVLFIQIVAKMFFEFNIFIKDNFIEYIKIMNLDQQVEYNSVLSDDSDYIIKELLLSDQIVYQNQNIITGSCFESIKLNQFIISNDSF
ncbi:hypothetical protein pb186bvf_003872 [Paramecium bursaria]